MKDQPWLKLLDLVRHKLGAEDARIEIGGREPTDPRLVWATLEDERRVVVVFAEPPARDATKHLQAIIQGFEETLSVHAEPPRGHGKQALHRELDLALAALADRTGAETVWIIDVHSPVLWAASESHADDLDVDALTLTARADQVVVDAHLSWAEILAVPPLLAHERLREVHLTGATLRNVQDELEILHELVERGGLAAAGRRLRSARALAEIRGRAAHDKELTRTELRGPAIQCFAHAIAGQYQLVLVFDETYSPLHAEANVARALPHIERLLLSLPPVDPASGGAKAKVIRLPRRV